MLEYQGLQASLLRKLKINNLGRIVQALFSLIVDRSIDRSLIVDLTTCFRTFVLDIALALTLLCQVFFVAEEPETDMIAERYLQRVMCVQRAIENANFTTAVRLGTSYMRMGICHAHPFLLVHPSLNASFFHSEKSRAILHGSSFGLYS